MGKAHNLIPVQGSPMFWIPPLILALSFLGLEHKAQSTWGAHTGDLRGVGVRGPRPYLSHALVFLHRHKLVVHAMDEQDGHSELSMVDLITFGPVLAAHHGSQNEGRHIERVALF